LKKQFEKNKELMCQVAVKIEDIEACRLALLESRRAVAK
jgi:hypothetical protein